jgi:subtilase family serine protease
MVSYKPNHININNLSLENLDYNYSFDIPQYISINSLREAYNIPIVQNNPDVRKVKVAIVIAYSYANLLNDFNNYWYSPITHNQSVPLPEIKVHTMSGALYNEQWAQESCLDLQILASINPNAEIWVVESRSSYVPDMVKAVNYATDVIKADVISMSWGVNDTSILSRQTQNFKRNNVCFCASSGDENVASWPSVLSECLSIGGTTLNIFGNKKQENNWNSAGCGYSSFVPKPSFQNNMFTNINKRIIPDVSGIANPATSVYTFFDNNWIGLGGTSVSAPIWAGILSLANQIRLNNNKNVLSTSDMSLQEYLYKNILENEQKYNLCFNDITNGGTYGSSLVGNDKLTFFSTLQGFDVATGLGSPNVQNLCNEIAQI